MDLKNFIINERTLIICDKSFFDFRKKICYNINIKNKNKEKIKWQIVNYTLKTV